MADCDDDDSGSGNDRGDVGGDGDVGDGDVGDGDVGDGDVGGAGDVDDVGGDGGVGDGDDGGDDGAGDAYDLGSSLCVFDRVFDALGWPHETMRLVSSAMRAYYDAFVPLRHRPVSRWIVAQDDLDAARTDSVFAFCSLRIASWRDPRSQSRTRLEFVDISAMAVVRELLDAGRVHTLSMPHLRTPLASLAPLVGVYALCLSTCDWLRDVSALAGAAVRDIDLHDCRLLCNVAPLGGARRLNLAGCELVEDVSALGAVVDLDLGGCVRVRDVSALTGARRVVLRGTAVSDVSALRNAADVDASACSLLRNVAPLAAVARLNLSNNPQIKDFSALGAQRELVLARCDALTDAALVHFAGVDVLDLTECAGIYDVGALAQPRASITLRNCLRVNVVDALRFATRVDISGCTGVSSVAAFGAKDARVRVLCMQRCKHVLSISNLYGLEEIYISGLAPASEWTSAQGVLDDAARLERRAAAAGGGVRIVRGAARANAS